MTVLSQRRSWFSDKILMGQTLPRYLRSLLTPFNVIAALIVGVGLWLSVLRYWHGLGAVTNLTDSTPWGLWIGFDVLVGVSLAGGGYMLASAVYIFRLEQYRPVVRPAILTGFLGYFFVAVAILFDLGRPWRLPYPFFYMGVMSVMFLIAWHVFLYLTCQFVEFSPAVFEWLGWKKLRKWAVSVALPFTIFGVMLSTLHQSALGALFLLAPERLHPLWYSPLIPLYFFVSSMGAGLAMVIFESTLSHRIFSSQLAGGRHHDIGGLTLGMGKAAAAVLFLYFWLKVLGIMHGNHWDLLGTAMGGWFLLEMLGGILLPCILFLWAVQTHNVRLVRFASVLTVAGIVLNRLNVAVIAFNWNLPGHYYPRWSEVVITISLVTLLVVAFRWIVNRMPVLRDHPDYPGGH